MKSTLPNPHREKQQEPRRHARHPRLRPVAEHQPVARMIQPRDQVPGARPPTISPAKGASGQIGSVRNRSNSPFPRSVDSPIPE